jgi:GT2 family glycosyltransferase
MKISVVIPCRNEEKNIEACIDAIYANSITQKEEIEVLVIDGQSTDNTLSVIDELIKKHPTLRYIENPKKVTPVAFNIGIKEAQGTFIQIIGARQIISKNYLEKAVEKVEENPEIWCLGGAVENIFENNTAETISMAMDSKFGVGGGNFRLVKESAFVDTVGTPMYPAHVFEKIGLFDESLVRNQDDELNYRVTKAGGKIFLYHEIQIKYFVRASFKNLFKQYFQYGYWKVFVNKKHRTVTTLRQLIPMLLVLYLLIGGALSFLHEYLLYVYLGGIGFYIIAGLLFAAMKTLNPVRLIGVFYSFLLLHFSYGWGYIRGIIRFFILNKPPKQSSAQLSR